MQEVHYMVTVEDIAHLNHHHFRASPRARRSMFLMFAGMTGLLGVSMFSLMILFGMMPSGGMMLMFLFLGALGVRAYTRKRPDRAFVRRVKRLFEDGRNVNLFGQHHLLLHEDCLELRTPYSQGTIRWEAVERVEQDEDYIFIYTSSLNAHIIHKRYFPSVDHAQAFFALAQRLHQGALQLSSPYGAPAGYLPAPPARALPGPLHRPDALEPSALKAPTSSPPLRLPKESQPSGIDGSL